MNEPLASLQLTFETHQDYLVYSRKNKKMLTQVWLWHETLGNQEEPIQLPGICNICVKQTIYSISPRRAPAGDQFNFRANWWLGLTCGCRLSTLDRAVFSCFLDDGRHDDQIYHVGYHSAFRNWLANRLPNVIASQYEAGREPGEIEKGIQYEDLTRLSFADGTFDCIIATEILEHIPDYELAIREMARVLKPGGRALMTFPWLGGNHYDHRTRAKLLPDGSIMHILPPEYHGDPASADRILSFRAFGWKILDELRDLGFTQAGAKFTFGPTHGHMTLQHPVIVAVR